MGRAAGASAEMAAEDEEEISMQGIRPCLTYSDQAEEAINLYVSVFKNSRVVSVVRSDGSGPIPAGRLMHATFELDGREYTAFDGGPTFTFSEGFSMVVTCDTQEEIDEVWARLTERGEAGRCGWLKDPFGVSWQIVPSVLGEMMTDSKSGSPEKVMAALLNMGKLDIAALAHAYRSGS
jgi:predicted 3-demethylubiquinone-9 3-methyltransferase (glyoxalase superfamily)